MCLRELLAIDIFETVPPERVEMLQRIFQKRHPITHNLGVVDKKYLERLRSADREGREVLVNSEEINEVLSIVNDVVTQLHARLFGTPG